MMKKMDWVAVVVVDDNDDEEWVLMKWVKKKKFGGKIFFRPLYAARPGMHRACDTAESDPCLLHGRTRGLSSLQKIQ